ncbi:MAG: RagB/SusD family nutrient uptake outer membrane protein, partial [Prolixibacteraceae bacterium]
YSNGFNFWVRPRNGSTIFGLGFCMPTQDLVNEFEANDPRLRYTVIRDGDIISEEVKDYPFQAAWAPETGMSCGKYVVDVPVGVYAEKHEQNLKNIRYAEVLLGYAEAAFRVGNKSEAAAKINMVRARARGGNTSVLPDVSSSDDLFNAIVHERRVELALEGKRYFDLVRWELAESELGALGYQPARKGLYPIPQTELDVNPNLKQNTGY